MKKFILLVLIICSQIVFGYDLVFKKNFSEISGLNFGIVNIEKLNVRSGPSTVYPRIEKIYLGDRVNIKEAVSDSWLEIILPPVTGYIHKDFFTVEETREVMSFDFDTSEIFTDYSDDTSEISDTREVFGMVSANSVNVRSLPNEDGDRVAIVNKRVRLRVLETLEEWYRISFLSKRTAYVYAKYISKERKGKVRMDFTPVFVKPSKSKIIRHIPKDMEIDIFEKSGDFFKVYIKEYKLLGWIPKESVVE